MTTANNSSAVPDGWTTNHGGAYLLAVFAMYAMSEWLVDGAIALLVAVL